MARNAMVGVALVLLGATGACTDGTVGLFVELKTDLRPGEEFALALVRVYDQRPSDGVTPIREVRESISPVDPVLDGYRIAELEDLSTGDYYVEVVLLDVAEQFIAERTLIVDLAETRAVVVLITRDCQAIECPAPDDDPGALSCLGGSCRDPDCEGDACGPAACTTAADCPAPAPCAASACDEGACFYTYDDGACASDEICAPLRGCEPTIRIALVDERTGEEVFLFEDGATFDVSAIAGPTLVEDHEIIVQTAFPAAGLTLQLGPSFTDPQPLDEGGFRIFAGGLRVGPETVMVAAFPTTDTSGTPIATRTLDIELLLDVTTPFRVTDLRIVRLSTGEVLTPVVDAATISLSTLPPDDFHLEVVTDPPNVGSVHLLLVDGGGTEVERTENWRPYSLSAGLAWIPSPGTYSITATPFSLGDRNGTTGEALTRDFELTP